MPLNSIERKKIIEAYHSITNSKIRVILNTRHSFKKGNQIVAKTQRGIELLTVVNDKSGNLLESFPTDAEFMRTATGEDINKYELFKEEAVKAGYIFQNKLPKYNLDMRLVGTSYTLDKKKLVFYFSADDRVDFRDFVKELASIFKLRIELRQLGVRDYARIIGDCGMCGKQICCKSFIGKFESVSIKMIRDQNIFVIPSKISGICGRLKCCVGFEQEYYNEMQAQFPEVGQKVETEEGIGEVISINVISEVVFVNVFKKGVKKFNLNDIKFNIAEKNKLKREKDKCFQNTMKSENIKE